MTDMTYQQIVQKFGHGKPMAAADFLSVPRPTFSSWKARGVPKSWQLALNLMKPPKGRKQA